MGSGRSSRFAVLLPLLLLACGRVRDERAAGWQPDGGGNPGSRSDAGKPAADAGAGPVDAGAQIQPKSGSAVAVIGWVSDGTALGVKEYHDRRHDVRCHLGLADDGVERCLPNTVGEIDFLDAACQHPVLANDDVCAGEPTGYKEYANAADTSCNKRVHILQVGARTDPPSQLFTIDSTTGNCVANTGNYSGFAFYALAPVPASDWVAYKRSVTRVTSQLGVETFTGDDGSRIDGTLRLLPGDIECEPLASDGNSSTVAPNRCIPTARVNEATYYTDTACGIAVTAGTPCDAPVIGQRIAQADGCPTQSYFELGSAVPPAKLFWKLNGELKGLTPEQSPCDPAAPSLLAGGIYNQIGADIDVTRYPLIEAKPEGTGRVQALFWESEGVPLERVDGVVGNDAPAGQQCSLNQFGDGNRCAFSLGSIGDFAGLGEDFYGDTACTRPLYSTPDTPLPDCGNPIPKPQWVQDSHVVQRAIGTNNDTCTTTAGNEAVRPVLGEHTGPVYVGGGSSNQCVVLNPADLPIAGNTGQPEKFRFYDLGDPLDAGNLFAPITMSEL